jgi:hypothetical protein
MIGIDSGISLRVGKHACIVAAVELLEECARLSQEFLGNLYFL